MAVVFTIGYEQAQVDGVIAALKTRGVTALADIRAVAISRKQGFSKNALRARLAEHGIAYIHFSDLGDPKPGRDAARAGRHDEFRRIYSAHLATPRATAALHVLRETMDTATVCLLCFERDPTTCHRRLITDRLGASGVKVIDLFAGGRVSDVGDSRFFWKPKASGVIEAERDGYKRASQQSSLLDKEIAALEPTPYAFVFSYEDDAGRHLHQCSDWETSTTYWKMTKQYGEAEALRHLSETYNEKYPSSGMAFAMGTVKRRPGQWLLLGVIRLDALSSDETAQASFVF